MLEKLNQDMIGAMRAKEKERLTVIRMVKASIKQEVIDHKRKEDDELLIDVVNKQIKMRKDSIIEFEKAGRDDLVSKTQSEVDILMKYLPEQLSLDEVNCIIEEAFSSIHPSGIKDMGKIMGEVSPKLKGRADMKKVSEIIRSKLQ